MSSIDMKTTGAVLAAPTSVGRGLVEARPYPAVCGPVDGALLAAPVWEAGLPVLGADAPVEGTGLPAVAGTRVRPAPVGVLTGSGTTAVAFAAASVQIHRTTPGDLPPEDPLS